MGTRSYNLVVLRCILWLAGVRINLRGIFHRRDERWASPLRQNKPLHANSLYILGRTLEETAAIFDGDHQNMDLINMGGVAADMSMRLSRGVITEHRRTVDFDPFIKTQQNNHEEYYDLKKRNRDSDATATASSSDLHARAL